MRAWLRALSVLVLVGAGLGTAPPVDAAVATTQVITVRASSYTTTYGVLEAWQRTSSGSYRRVAGPWTARVGPAGLAGHDARG